MSCKPPRALAFVSILTAAALLARGPALAAEAAFAIEAQDLASALKAFAFQSHREIFFAPQMAQGKRTQGVNGKLDDLAALEALLEGTGLSYTLTKSNAILLREDLREAGVTPDSRPSSYPLLAQAESPSAGSDRAASGTDNAAPQQQKADNVELEEIVVTGTHIRGVTETAVPSTTITQEDIERGGYSSIESVFRDLPQNFGEITAGGAANAGASRLGSSNADYTSGIDLRGLGAQSTLVLLNGTRRAPSNHGLYVDVSTIPVSVIDRVEVVTAGRSAIYGADAVAGVVNLITRRRFEGVETQLFYDWAQDGGENFQGSLTTGGQFDRGGIVVAYDFARDWSLDLMPIGLNNPQFLTGSDWVRRNYIPDTDRHTGFLAGELKLTDNIELLLDAIFTSKDVKNLDLQQYPGAAQISTRSDRVASDIYNVSVGSRIGLADSWTLTASAGVGNSNIDHDAVQFDDFGPFTSLFESQEDDAAKLLTLSLVVDGALPAIGHIVPRVAAGVEHREENLDRKSSFAFDGVALPPVPFDLERDAQSVFGEVLIPLVDSGPAGLRGLDLSLAGRYDDYSDFGSKFSPQVGAVWKIVSGLQWRGAYSQAFRAPALNERRERDNGASIQEINDPATADISPVLFFGGDANNELTPEEADVWSMSVDYQPHFAPATRISATYFNITYEDRIEFPIASVAAFPLVLVDEALYPGLVDRSPTDAEIDAIVAQLNGPIFNLTPTPWDPTTQSVLEAFPNLVIFDSRLNNVAEDRVSGVDLDIDSKFETAAGTLSLGLNATRTLEHERRITATSPSFGILNEVGNPVDLRARFTAGMTRGAYGILAAVNYTDSYVNRLTTPSSHVASWTTVDLTFRIDGSSLQNSGFLNGFRAIVGLNNALDREPPRVATDGYLFDAANASPIGRQISLRLVKGW